MKQILPLVATIALLFPASGVTAPKKIHQRAWLGGEFKLAKRGGEPFSSDRVGAFPKSIEQRAGIFVAAVHVQAPLAVAGVATGDLILALDDRPVTSLKALRSVVESRAPGDTIRLSVYRDGDIEEHTATLGVESFEQSRNIGVGLMLSHKIDLVPNPDFSAVALGFHRRDQRIDLCSPEAEFYLRHRKGAGGKRGVAGSEGWQAWCVLFSFGSHKQIVSQELFAPEKQRAALR